MIFITYQTKELKALCNFANEVGFTYEKINKFFEKYEIAIERNIVKDSLEDILRDINETNSYTEKIYYEKVDENFNYKIEPVEIFTKWKELFKTLNDNYENKIREKNFQNFLTSRLKIIVINNNNKLGPWQSIEILNTLPYKADIYWIDVKNFLNVIEEVEEKMNPTQLMEFNPCPTCIFINCLFDKAKKIR